VEKIRYLKTKQRVLLITSLLMMPGGLFIAAAGSAISTAFSSEAGAIATMVGLIVAVCGAYPLKLLLKTDLMLAAEKRKQEEAGSIVQA
jgi:hypothetical protein